MHRGGADPSDPPLSASETPADSIVAWTSGNKNIRKTDVAAWITFGVTHVPRPEDFPVMPVEHCRLLLKPVGFFDKNPGAWKGVCEVYWAHYPLRSARRAGHDRPILRGGLWAHGRILTDERPGVLFVGRRYRSMDAMG